MIWDIIEQSTFDKYFQNPDSLTVQTLLLDQNIITQFKNLNPKLIQQYLQNHKQQFITKLIQYTVQLPQLTDSEDRIKKFPYVSSEVLSIDNEIIYKSFLQQKPQKAEQIDYFAQLMKIFQNKGAADNEILLGYFVKIIQNLYKCQKRKTANKIYEFRQVYYNHLNKQSVGTVLKLFLILLQVQDEFMLDQRLQVTRKLVDCLVQEQQNIKVISKNILTEVISKFQTFSSGDQLLKCILESQKLNQIFQIKNSQSIDQFIIGYLTKALQKICTSDDTKKSLIQISQNHKQKIKMYIKNKKEVLNVHQTQSFKNQSSKIVQKTDKNILSLLVLTKLALSNGIIEFFQEKDIQNLWRLIQIHPYNDIIKVKIFDIFSLFYNKKDETSKSMFEKIYISQTIGLFKKSKQMFGYFLYQLWKVISKKSTVFNKIPPQQTQQWKKLLEYFKQNDLFEQQAHKVVQKYSNRTKVVKLVVDQQDAAPIQKEMIAQQSSKQQIQGGFNVQTVMPTQKQYLQINRAITFQTNFKQGNTSSKSFSQKNTSQSSKAKQKPKFDPFASFDFFNKTQYKKQEKQEKKQQKKKVADFSDFSSFF